MRESNRYYFSFSFLVERPRYTRDTLLREKSSAVPDNILHFTGVGDGVGSLEYVDNTRTLRARGGLFRKHLNCLSGEFWLHNKSEAVRHCRNHENVHDQSSRIEVARFFFPSR